MRTALIRSSLSFAFEVFTPHDHTFTDYISDEFLVDLFDTQIVLIKEL